ncbi:MAG TPA: cell division protein FtsZ, partial [Patescibacteria group bacterium]|nr:cell division protein FtsZ [Patescibacteria group bacterium]
LSVAVVTKPFSFEGGPRKKVAEEGFSELEGKVDTLITIPNDRIWQIIDKKTPLLEAFAVVDEVLRQGVQGVSELITLPGMINVDFADIKTIMEQSGAALMGMGEASGDNRAIEAAKAAVSSPLLELSVEGAKGILFTITGGSDLTMYEVSEAAKAITESVDSDARIIFGAVVNENLKDKIKITVVATGFDKDSKGYMSRSGVASRPGISGNQKPNYFSAKPWAQRDEKSESVNNNGGFNTRENTYKSENNNSGIDAKKLEQETLEPEKPEDSDRIDPKEVMPDEEKKSEGDDEDLEIPAFIRRKMM